MTCRLPAPPCPGAEWDPSEHRQAACRQAEAGGAGGRQRGDRPAPCACPRCACPVRPESRRPCPAAGTPAVQHHAPPSLANWAASHTLRANDMMLDGTATVPGRAERQIVHTFMQRYGPACTCGMSLTAM